MAEEQYHPLLPRRTYDGFLQWAGTEQEVTDLMAAAHEHFLSSEEDMRTALQSLPPPPPPGLQEKAASFNLISWSEFDHLIKASGRELNEGEEPEEEEEEGRREERESESSAESQSASGGESPWSLHESEEDPSYDMDVDSSLSVEKPFVHEYSLLDALDQLVPRYPKQPVSKIKAATATFRKAKAASRKRSHSLTSSVGSDEDTTPPPPPLHRWPRSGQCYICLKMVKRLDKHGLIHLGVKPHKCSFCKSSFRQSEHLKRHVQRIHIKTQSPHQCPICLKTLSRKDKLKEHRRLCSMNNL